MSLLGALKGTIERKRQTPRMKVQDVAITEAAGITFGPDGYSHPLEVTGEGELKVVERGVSELLEELLIYQKAIVYGLSLQTDVDLLAAVQEDEED